MHINHVLQRQNAVLSYGIDQSVVGSVYHSRERTAHADVFTDGFTAARLKPMRLQI